MNDFRMLNTAHAGNEPCLFTSSSLMDIIVNNYHHKQLVWLMHISDEVLAQYSWFTMDSHVLFHACCTVLLIILNYQHDFCIHSCDWTK